MNESTPDTQSTEPSEAVRLAEAAARAAEAEAEKAKAETERVKATSTEKWEGLGCIVFIIAIALVVIFGILAKAGVFN